MLSRLKLKELLVSNFSNYENRKITELDSVELVTFIADSEQLLAENNIDKKLMNDEFLGDLKDEDLFEKVLNYIYESN
jgi:hypothetical protein